MGLLRINELARLYLGVQEESESRTIEIDMSAWALIYPNATAEILHKRNGDQTKYVTGATYNSDTKILSWTPTEYDTFYPGFGTAEIRMVQDEVVKKTKDLLVTAVSPSVIDGTGTVTASNYQAWLNAAIAEKQAAVAAKVGAEAAQAAAEAAQEAAEDAVVKSPYVDSTTGNWFVWDWDSEDYIDTGVHAQGEKGNKGDKGDAGHTPVIAGSKSGKTSTITADGQTIATILDGNDGEPGAAGFSPTAVVTKVGKVANITVTDKTGTTNAQITDGEDGYSVSASVTKIGKVATITITDKDGTTTAAVTDGTDADPEDLIDDTAGYGDTDKVWSANKTRAIEADVGWKADQEVIAWNYGELDYPVAEGTYCFRNGDLFRAVQDIPTYETWTGEHWEYVTIGDELCNVKSVINGKQTAPETAGAAGQVLALDSNLEPVWTDQTGGDSGNSAPVIVNHAEGSIASFSDGAEMHVKDCVVSIEPVQDLHGQDAPYPPGGGKNKLQNTATTQTVNGITFTVNADGTVNANGTASDDIDFTIYSGLVLPSGNYILNGCPSGGSTSTYRIFATNYGSDTGSGLAISANGTTSTTVRINIKNGTTANNQLYKPMIRLSSVSDDTFAPYSNICPITGWTGANVSRTGKNLIPFPYYEQRTGDKGVTWAFGSDGSVTITGTATGTAYCNLRSNSAPLLLNAGTYTKNLSGVTGIQFNFYKADGTIIAANQTATFTLTESTYVYYYIRIADGVAFTNFTLYPQLELGSTASSFSPYIGSVYPISWQTEAGTVYGGTLDVTTGLLTVDRASVGLGTLTWTYNATRGTFVSTDMRSVFATGEAICSHYPETENLQNAYMDAQDKVFGINASPIIPTGSYASNDLVVKDSAYSDAVAFKTAMSGVQLVYELATPIVYNLTPVEIRALLGENHIWADTGDIAVEYCADTKTYVDNAIPEIPEAPVQDVQVNGTSVVDANGVANVPIASGSTFGVVKPSTEYGIGINNSGNLFISGATVDIIKSGLDSSHSIVPNNQHQSVFYGLATASGDTTQSASSNAVGVYTESAKSSIAQMLDAPESVSGTTPSITAKAGVRYVCGECATLDITAPASGCIDVTFTSGSTATVLTVSSAKTGVTAIKWANGFDPTALDANTVYEINILDGEYGVVGSWA